MRWIMQQVSYRLYQLHDEGNEWVEQLKGDFRLLASLKNVPSPQNCMYVSVGPPARGIRSASVMLIS